MSSGLGLIALVITPASSPPTLVPGLLLCGLGIGFVFSPLGNVTISSVDRTLVGSASGIFNTARQVGGVFGSAAAGVLLQVQISASTVRRANEAALALPAEFRQRFVSGFTDVAGGATRFGDDTPALPADLPPEIADQARHLAGDVIQNGLTDAVKISFLLPVGALLLGLLFSAAMRATKRPSPVPATAESARRSTGQFPRLGFRSKSCWVCPGTWLSARPLTRSASETGWSSTTWSLDIRNDGTRTAAACSLS